jgi:hypothetical protein
VAGSYAHGGKASASIILRKILEWLCNWWRLKDSAPCSYGFFSDAVIQNRKIINTYYFVNDVEGSGRRIIRVKSLNLCGETEENHKNPQSE